MFKLIIVDDENYICQGLKNFRWDEIDAEVVGVASNGLAACKFISENHVDIILSDIKMPIMDGMQLVKYVAKNNPYIKVIMLTGYDEFEYVRTSLRCGVIDYILKPVNEKLLFEAALKAIEVIKKEKMISNKIISLENKASAKTKLLRDKYLPDILFKLNKEEHLEEMCVYGEILLDSSESCVCIIRIDSYTANKNIYNSQDWGLIKFALKNILNEVFDDKGYGYSWVCEETCNSYLIVSDGELIKSQDSLYSLIQEMQGCIYNIRGLIKSTVSVVIGTIEANKGGIYSSRYNAEAALNKLEGEGQIYKCGPEDISSNAYEKSAEMEEQYIPQGDVEQSKPMVNKVKEYININYMHPITLSEVAEEVCVSPAYLSHVFKSITGENFIHYLTNVRIKNAMKLLKDPRYKVYEVGDLVGYENPRYFSDIFKKTTGKTPQKFRNE